MNKIESKFNLKTLFMFLTMLVLSLSMVLATACTNGGATSTSTSTSEESTSESTAEEAEDDEQLFKNGDFEHPTNKYPGKDPITLSSSSTKWTGSVDGEVGYQINSSTVKRGIIDVADSEDPEVTDDPFDKLQGNTTYKNVLTTNPGTPVSNGLISAEEIEKATEDGLRIGEDYTRLLMLYNKDYAAQYVTSTTSLKVPAGQYGKLTVWVYTLNLERTVGSDAGAYIKVKNNVTNPTVEGTTYDPLVVENIDTNGVWTKYTIYLAPNTSKSSTFTVVLGLGEGNKLNVENHVKGFAFFDNVSFELIDSAAYGDVTADTTIEIDTTGEEYALTSDRVDGQTNKVVKFDLTEGVVDTSFNLGGEVAADAVLLYPEELASNYVTYNATEDVLKFDFSSFNNIGAAYTYESAVHTLEGGKYVRISFLAKIEAEDYQTQATIALYDVAKGENVAVFENVSTKDFEDENNDNFARFTFYVANNFFYEKEGVVEFEESMQYQLKISFGPTDESVINQLGGKLTLPIGTATFKNFEIEYLTKDNYNIADVSSDTRAKKATLIGGYSSDYVAPKTEEDEDDDEATDSYNVNLTGYGKVLLQEGNVVSLNELTSTTLFRSENTTENDATIGVVNSKYVSSYNSYIAAALNGAQAKLDAMRDSETNVNKYVQALAIHNVCGTNYVLGNTISVPKNTTYVFSIKVYVHGNATAFVKLVDINNQGADFLNYSTTVKFADSNTLRDGFATVTFVITTGFENYDVRLKFGVEGENGVALFQSLLPGSANSSYTSFEALKTTLNTNDIYAFVEESKLATTTYYYASENHAGDLSLALKDEDGNVRKTVSSKKEVNKGYATLDFEGASTLVIYNRLNLDDRYIIEAPETPEVPESTVDPATQGTKSYGWLQVTSILLALALVLALIAVVVRKSAEGKNKKRKNTESYYQGYNKNKYSRNNDVAVPDEDDKAKDYDYENPENN